jgi:signal transduction histidine kinase
MKSPREIELGILPTFRLFTGVQFAITALGLIAQWIAPSQPQLITMSPLNLLEPGLLLVYLSIPRLQRQFKSAYIPIGIAWAVMGLILDPYLAGNISPDLSARWIWRQILFLFAPLVVVSWQYSMRQVFLYSGLVAVLNLFLFSRTLTFQELISDSLLAVFLIQLTLYLLAGNMIVKFMKIQRDQWQQLRDANERLARHASTVEQLTISRERNRLAREVHDVLAHTLSGVAVQLEGVRAMLHHDPEQAGALLNHSLQAVREGLTETRRALQELRAKPLEDLGLTLAIKSLAESIADRVDSKIEAKVDNNLGDISVELEQCIYRITQEALTNIADHAQAKSAQLTLKREGAQIKLIITDDGCGFDPNALDGNNKYGLRGMRERAEMIGGNLSIESQPGKGTTILFSYGVSG